MTDPPAGAPQQTPELALRAALEELADQLCFAVDGNFDFAVRVSTEDETIEKLAMLINFLVDTARRGMTALSHHNEALAELDRAKTTFFSNISHEFRTPLTLMLGPLQDAAEAGEGLAGDDLKIVRRNTTRLLKLVNALLDFSRIEAGRMDALFQATDLGTLTAEVAAAFRSAIAGAGLQFEVDCPQSTRPVFVDRSMWEKIVLNLVSNALKFTFAGAIHLSLTPEGDRVVLRVRDTGIGIAEKDMPRLFERFHRIEGARARTHEGSGIGLALVNEFVRLHGGTVEVSSIVDYGTSFTLSIPTGSAHLPPDRIAAADHSRSADVRAAFEEEAATWSDSAEVRSSVSQEARAHRGDPGYILVVDDNADMRRYLSRLLSAHWHVRTVSDGGKALEMLRSERPALVLSDVMMPVLDGYALLREMRADARIRDVPIILLSARAGEEARIDGLEAGADDYLVKPFAGRELIARVRTQIDLRRMRAVASRNEARYRSLVLANPNRQAIFVTTSEGVVDEEAATWCDITGQTQREMLGTGWQDAVHPDDHGRVNREWTRAIASRGLFDQSFRLRMADRSYRWYAARAVPVRDDAGSVVEWVVSTVDVDDRHAADEWLQFTARTNEAFAASIEYDMTLATVCQLAVPALADFCAVDIADDTSERSYRRFATAHQDPARVAHAEAMSASDPAAFESGDTVRAIRSGQSRLFSDITDEPADAARARQCEALGVVSLMVIPLRSRGAIAGVVTLGSCARTFGPRDLAQAEEFVTRAAVAIDNASLYRSARAANQAKDAFLATLSHELRTPMTAILGWSRLMRMDPPLAEPEIAIEAIEKSAEAQAQLIEDVLDVSRITSGKLTFDPKPVDLLSVARAAVSTVRPTAEAREVEITVDLPAHVPPVAGSEGRLQQIIWNLLTNALKFTPKGGRVTLSMAVTGSIITTTVSDTGEGIEPEFLSHLFEVFWQRDTTTTRDRGGLGLGLSIVKTLVELHGGRITVTSDGPGCGTTFAVDLPLVESFTDVTTETPEMLVPLRRPSTVLPDLSGRTVLVVDDQQMTRDVVSAILRGTSAYVNTAASVRDALDSIDSARPDIVVCDIAMPSEDGYSFLRQLRGSALTATIPVIALTAFGRDEDRQNAIDAGFDSYLKKPVEPYDLAHEIQRFTH